MGDSMRLSPSLLMGRGRRGVAAIVLAGLAAGSCGTSGGDTATTARGGGSAGQASACYRPYASTSPWNTPVPKGAGAAADSARLIGTITTPLTSDPTQYTYPVYVAGPKQPRRSVHISDLASIVTAPRRLRRTSGGVRVRVPIPAYAQPSDGSDSQVIVLDPRTHDEWGFWQFSNSGGSMGSTNGYRYNDAWSGVPPNGFASRGAGVPYLAGLVRPCEIAHGNIQHALAFVFPNTTSQHVYPATKSDGHSSPGHGMAEGTRLQLDPSVTDNTIRSRWGCRGPCFTIAKALQRYGMYLIDTGGHSKIVVEDQITARWRGRDTITRSTVTPIPITSLRVVAP
jgi:hypothetical protein